MRRGSSLWQVVPSMPPPNPKYVLYLSVPLICAGIRRASSVVPHKQSASSPTPKFTRDSSHVWWSTTQVGADELVVT